jgi:hypothetical protein
VLPRRARVRYLLGLIPFGVIPRLAGTQDLRPSSGTSAHLCTAHRSQAGGCDLIGDALKGA